VIQLAACTPYQVGQPTQALIKFLRNGNKPKMTNYEQPHTAVDIKHPDKTKKQQYSYKI